MAKMITRTIKSDTVIYNVVDKNAKIFLEKEITFPTHFASEEKALKQGKREINDDNFEVISIKSIKVKLTKYEMLESDFVKNGKEVK